MKRKQRFFKLSAIVGCILLGAGMLLCGAGFVAMGCNWNAFTYPRGGEPVAGLLLCGGGRGGLHRDSRLDGRCEN